MGTALNQSFANASGDFATVIGALAGLNTQQGPQALNTISGEPYADFGTMNTNNAMLFMNALGQQMANARGSSASTGQRQALAQACEIESCDAVGPLSAWASALGGLGSVLGDTNASTLTYNFGGAAAGIDYRFDPRFLAGIGVGYTHGTQWVNTFMGQGWTDWVSVAAYGSFTQSGFYVDALAGYAYYGNQLQRQILIPGLQQRTATGSTGANQFLGQIEGGYKLGVYAPAAATITPFGRFQISSTTQNAFSESGAQSLSLNVAQQTTNSQRTTIGADLGSSIGLGNERKLDLAVRLGWMHEFADTGRPITAAFAGAPGNSFTVFGATPLAQRRGGRPPGHHQHRRRDADLPALRRRDRHRHRQPRPQCRRAHELVDFPRRRIALCLSLISLRTRHPSNLANKKNNRLWVLGHHETWDRSCADRRPPGGGPADDHLPDAQCPVGGGFHGDQQCRQRRRLAAPGDRRFQLCRRQQQHHHQQRRRHHRADQRRPADHRQQRHHRR